MSEKITPNAYLLPAELMEPQRPVTPDEYSVVKREKIEDAQLRSIPESLNPVYMQSARGEKAVKGGEGSEFNKTQDAAYAEREKSRNAWLERSLGDVALEATVIASVSAEVPSSISVERAPSQETGLDIKPFEDLVTSLKYANENNRNVPEAEGRQSLGAYIIKKADAVYDEFMSGKISKESYSVAANALLGAAGNTKAIDAVVGRLLDADMLDADERGDLSLHSSSIHEIGLKAGIDADRARIRLANELIERSQNVLRENDNVANGRYRAMVGLVAGLSTQINDPSTSSGFVHGALKELREHS